MMQRNVKTYLLIISELGLVIEHEQIRVPPVGRVEVGRVDNGGHDLGVGQSFQSFVSNVYRMLYRPVPVGVFVDDGRQYFGQMVSESGHIYVQYGVGRIAVPYAENKANRVQLRTQF